MSRLALPFVALLLGLVLAAPCAGDEATEGRRTKLLGEMRSLAEQTAVKFASSANQPKLIEQPVFRYDDQPRRFIDATMWIWTDGGRPVACQKIEAKLEFNTGEPLWGYCFTSLSTEKLEVQWIDRNYRTTEPGIDFKPLAGAPVPAAGNTQRKRQSRELARGFAGRILQNPRTGDSSEMRLLPTPIFEYAEPQTNVLRGAVFGFETNGTNPDLLVLLEVNGSPEKREWQFAPARMTTGGITLNYHGAKVWEAPFVSPNEGPFANWLFFRTPRTPVPGERAP
jgi:hypothetical protein